ncbi:MAG: glycosyltransferase family 25 protein [Chlamydiales bacterium]|nr:glycosyltransferase family 25 protein [Chlamydiales bacterium]
MNLYALIFTLFSLLFNCAEASLRPYLKRVENKREGSQIRNIDFIYLINLEQRPDKFAGCMRQLAPYNISPHKFFGIYGWRLPTHVLDQIGVKFLPSMWTGRENALHFYPNGNGSCQMIALNDSWYGKTCFSSWMTPGAIGCTLSHLSVLQDAYDSGYETIWIMEDDILVAQDPHKLSALIDELDLQVGKNGWDLLYTDCDYLMGLDESRDLQAQVPMKWRPDMPSFNLRILLEHTDVGDDFIKIGSRIRTHSMILRRSGIKKILDFYHTHHIFMPYDHELGFIPNIRLFVVREGIVTSAEAVSDTKNFHF